MAIARGRKHISDLIAREPLEIRRLWVEDGYFSLMEVRLVDESRKHIVGLQQQYNICFYAEAGRPGRQGKFSMKDIEAMRAQRYQYTEIQLATSLMRSASYLVDVH